MDVITVAERARAQKGVIASADERQKNAALISIKAALNDRADYIVSENAYDVSAARDAGTSEYMLDRLTLTHARIDDIAKSIDVIINSEDPVGLVLSGKTLPNGLSIKKVTVPLGVIAVIYEARPNVTVDAAVLSLKSGNVSVLRGGKEAIRTNTALVGVMRDAVAAAGLPADVINLITDTSRESANALMKLNGYVDVLIPRGGAGLIHSCVENATVPVIETGLGNCHIYVDESADTEKAVSIIYNAKTSRPSVCNACESLVIHEAALERTLPLIAQKLREKNVEIRCDEKAMSVLTDGVPATEDDFAREYLGYTISVKTVSDVNEAIRHINKYSTSHSEAIITESLENAELFTKSIDSAAVYVNASTRFTDGGEFGLGAEIGISTQKLHARGPLGLRELTSYKYIVYGDGNVR